MQQKSLTLQDYIEIFWRRKWWFILPLMMGTALAIAYSYSLPALYRSSTLILVEPQRVPRSYVSPTVTSSVESRLNTISQQILSRTNLEKIIRDFGLYQQDEAATSGLEGVAERLKARVKKILRSFGLDEPEESLAWDPTDHVNRMREAIDIRVIGGRTKSAFTVAYSGRDPDTVMRVTNALASLFIEENLKVRERQAEGTSEFLAGELAMAERELRTFERNLKEFKDKHQGALPEQLEANLRTLDRLQLELQTINETLKSAEEQKIFYEQRFQEATLETETDQSTTLQPGPEPRPDPREAELENLNRKLTRLRAQFNDNYPDIIILKQRIGELEAQPRAESPPGLRQEFSRPTPSARSQRLTQLETELHTRNAEIESLRERQKRIISLIRDYEKRVEATYENELQLLTLTRNYGISQRSYENLLAKSLSAKMSENLEKKQKGEQFRILDPANFPKAPYEPDRPEIIMLGSLLSGAVGAGLIFLLEYLNACFRRPEDIQGVFNIPILVTIPRDRIAQKNKSDRLVAVEESDSMATEQYRVLYTRINDLSREKSQKIFAISSALRGEGKTVTALNLAVVMARDFGKKTLLLEGDFKAPSISRYLKAELESGLVDILLSGTNVQSTLIPFADTLIPFADDNLAVLPAVKKVQNSSGLLSSRRMKDLLGTLKEQYDFILIDAPPVLPLADMNVFEEVVDGIILVVRAEKTPRDMLLKAVDAMATDKLAGIVLNDVQQPLPEYQRYEPVRV